jgi:protein-disulfide isomerase
LRQIDDQYVRAGTVRVGYVHFAFLGQESTWAAEASECADEQGAFWSYHDYLFTHQKGENQGAFSRENLKTFAAELKLNTQTFNQCLDSGKYQEVVRAEVAKVQALGVPSTPAFAINGQPAMGVLSFEAFRQYIEAALKQ